MDIYYDEEVLSVKYDEDIDNTINWDDVLRIAAYKVYTYPGEVTFLVFDAVGGQSLEASDEMSGYTQLLAHLPSLFPLSEDWADRILDAEPEGDDVVIFRK